MLRCYVREKIFSTYILLLCLLWNSLAFAQNNIIFQSSFEDLNTITYIAGPNGNISGPLIQHIENGNDGFAVRAVPANGFILNQWSDGQTNNPRIDTNIQTSFSVTAQFVLNPFGQVGTYTVADLYQEPTELATIYYPTDASAINTVPVIIFIPGFGNTTPNSYDTILRFIASHGFAAIYVPDTVANDFSSSDMLVDIIAMINDPTMSPLLDTTRLGVIGHSSGGGYAFNILDKLSDTHSFGANGRFLFAIEPWYAFDMQQADILTLPANTNVLIQQYGIGGNNAANGTDARIPLTEYYLLESIAATQKDYQVYEDAGVNHGYPNGAGTNYAEKNIILAPLDALMDYTFVDSNNAITHDAALELGNDNPWNNGNGIQVVYPRGDASIAFPCNGYDFTNYDIDYCDIKGYPLASKFTPIPTNNSTVQPALLGMSIDLEFGTTITRMTERVLQQDIYNGAWNGGSRGNHHTYPKTQAWNADMTMIRLNYRIYDANTLQEIPLTTPSGNYPLTTNTWDTGDLYYINGALNEKKWSTVDPNVFYGVYLSGTNGQFWKGTIDRGNALIAYPATAIHTFVGDYEKFSLGKFEGNISYDDSLVVFAARKTGQVYLTAIVYDKTTDTVLAQKDFDGNNGNALIEWTDSPAAQIFDWMSVSPLGNHILISTDGKIEQYDMNLNLVRQLAIEANHGDMGIAQDGEEVYVQFKFQAPQGIYAYKLSDGTRTQLLPSKYNGGHISCRNIQRPGWCYVSVTQEGYREVFALRINFADQTKHVVNRFVQTHTRSYNAAGNSMNSLGNVSPDGRRVLFFTDWEQDPLDYYDRDTYQAQRVD